MEYIKTYLSEHQERFIQELLSLLRIPSVSADKAFKEHVYEAASFIEKKL